MKVLWLQEGGKVEFHSRLVVLIGKKLYYREDYGSLLDKFQDGTTLVLPTNFDREFAQL